jgi:hypothetical protein
MYFPLSQITPNLYTNGSEFIIYGTQQVYTGYYFKTSKGHFYTGRNSSDKPNQLLEPIPQERNDLPPPTLTTNPGYIALEYDINEESNQNLPFNPNLVSDYVNLANVDVDAKVYPIVYSPTLPTQQDYQIGEFRRYFCKKTNDLIYLEINQDYFDKISLKDPQVDYALYLAFYVDWQLTGDKQQVARTNKNIVELTIKRLSLPKFNLYLREDYTKYYQ